MMSTKRVILADGPRLLREMLHHVIDKADHLEVVQEVADQEHLASAIEKFGPEWVIVSSSANGYTDSRLNSWLSSHPSVRFMFLAAGDQHIRTKWQMSREEEYADLSLQDLIELLEKDLQCT
jgi:DNA-binding NarL/FixJ family response regulator